MGLAPLPDVADLLEAQGVRTAQLSLPNDISGITINDPKTGLFVAVNKDHSLARRRFSFAHEYCHLLVDRGRKGIVSRIHDHGELLEVRANAFAAAFLMPEEAVRLAVLSLGKGRPVRAELSTFDGEDLVRTRASERPGSQDLQLYDVVQVAHYFRVSTQAALYRLHSLRLVDQESLELMLAQTNAGHAREVLKLLGLQAFEESRYRDRFRRRYLGLALEAYRREEISHAKLVELAGLVQVSEEDLNAILKALGLDRVEPVDVWLPEDCPVD